jgi:hypothetical protein
MRVFQETTKDWTQKVSNHIYYTSDNKEKIVAFFNVDSGKVTKFKNPIRWDMRRRTFKELSHK